VDAPQRPQMGGTTGAVTLGRKNVTVPLIPDIDWDEIWAGPDWSWGRDEPAMGRRHAGVSKVWEIGLFRRASE
jgi:hypothetical protein